MPVFHHKNIHVAVYFHGMVKVYQKTPMAAQKLRPWQEFLYLVKADRLAGRYNAGESVYFHSMSAALQIQNAVEWNIILSAARGFQSDKRGGFPFQQRVFQRFSHDIFRYRFLQIFERA
jgi:hypothetical protein